MMKMERKPIIINEERSLPKPKTAVAKALARKPQNIAPPFRNPVIVAYPIGNESSHPSS